MMNAVKLVAGGLIIASTLVSCAVLKKAPIPGFASGTEMTDNSCPSNQIVIDANWTLYKSKFLLEDGRVLDNFSGVSHTEGQGTGMILSAVANDRAAFDLIWGWTETTLKRPDGLYSWRYNPNEETPIDDPNNASDGDLMIAWGLLRAYRAWKDPEHARAVLDLVEAIETNLTRELNGRTLLLPAIHGFEPEEGGLILNPSYYVFPAIADLARFADSDTLKKVYEDGVELIDHSGFGLYGLPADWVLATEEAIAIAEGWPPRFGYEAIRVPLYLSWGRQMTEKRSVPYCMAWYPQQVLDARLPAWIDLHTGEESSFEGSRAVRTIAALTGGLCGDGEALARTDFRIEDTDDYYAASLISFSAIAKSDCF